jgi:hypothetical protein
MGTSTYNIWYFHCVAGALGLARPPGLVGFILGLNVEELVDDRRLPKVPPLAGGRRCRSTEHSPESKAQTDRAPNLLKCSVLIRISRPALFPVGNHGLQGPQTCQEASQLLHQMCSIHRGVQWIPPAHGYLSGISYKQLGPPLEERRWYRPKIM